MTDRLARAGIDCALGGSGLLLTQAPHGDGRYVTDYRLTIRTGGAARRAAVSRRLREPLPPDVRQEVAAWPAIDEADTRPFP